MFYLEKIVNFPYPCETRMSDDQMANGQESKVDEASEGMKAAAGASRRPKKAKAKDQRQKLGDNLRLIRKLHNWSLSDIHKLTGIPLSTLSKIENGHATLTFEKIVLLTEKLGIEFADLVKPERNNLPSASRSITRSGTGARLTVGNVQFEFLSGELTASRSIAFKSTITARRDDANVPLFNNHSGEEFVYVLSGTLILYTEHYEPLALNPGDSIMFDASMGHSYAYDGEHPAVVIMVNEKYITPTSQSVFETLKARSTNIG